MKQRKYTRYLAMGLKELNADKQLKDNTYKEIRNVLFNTMKDNVDIKVTSRLISRSVLLFDSLNRALFMQLDRRCENKFPTLELVNGSCIHFETDENVKYY